MASYLNSNDLKTKFVLLKHCFEIHIAIKSPIGPGVHCQILQTRSASGVERGWWVGMGEARAFGWNLIIQCYEWTVMTPVCEFQCTLNIRFVEWN